MSSILDAVSKDAGRSGTIPGTPAGGPPPDPSGGGSGPSRFRSVALVIVFGVAIGAAAAHLYGGAEPAPEDLLTEKAAPDRKNREDVQVAKAAATARKPSRKPGPSRSGDAARKKKEAAPRPLVIPAPPKASPPTAAAPSAAPAAVDPKAVDPKAKEEVVALASATPDAKAEPKRAQGQQQAKVEAAVQAKEQPQEREREQEQAEKPVLETKQESDTKAEPAPPAATLPAEVATAKKATAPVEDPPAPAAATPPAEVATARKATASVADSPAPAAVTPPAEVATARKATAPVADSPAVQAATSPAAEPAAEIVRAPSPAAGKVVAGDADPAPDPTVANPVEPVAAADATDSAAAEQAAADVFEPLQPAVEEVPYERPSGAPEVSILFVAWSRSPTDRMASMRVGQGSLSVVREGEYVEGLQVSAIHPEAVDFQWTGQKFRVPVRPF